MPTNGAQLRARRAAAGIAGYVLSAKAGISRTTLSNVERGYVVPEPDEMRRLVAVLEGLIAAREQATSTAIALGWPAEQGLTL